MKVAGVVLAMLLVSGGAAAEPGEPASPAQLRVEAGRETFLGNCVGCHGLEARGCGTSARLYNPRPANLTRSRRSDEYRRSIIRYGGESVGRSPFMPPWTGRLDEDEIDSVVAWLRTLQPQPDATC